MITGGPPLFSSLALQAPDVYPDVLGLRGIARAPNTPQKLGVRQQVSPVDSQLAKQGELRRRQVDDLTRLGHQAHFQIDNHVTDFDPQPRGFDGFGRASPPEVAVIRAMSSSMPNGFVK